MAYEERTLLEQLLEAAFGAQCVREYEARMAKATQAFEELSAETQAESVMALNIATTKVSGLEVFEFNPGWIDDDQSKRPSLPSRE